MFKESDIVLSAKHIVKQFPASGGRTLTACNDVNLNVYKGKTLGIVGESGCGKQPLSAWSFLLTSRPAKRSFTMEKTSLIFPKKKPG